MIRQPLLIVVACLSLLCTIASAADSPAAAPPKPRQLNFQHGTVSISQNGQAIATIALPAGVSYLQSADARYVLEDIYGNPPDTDTLGLVCVPAQKASGAAAPGHDQAATDTKDAKGATAEDDTDGGIGIVGVVSYDTTDGHIKDDDASGIKYDELLKSMQESAKQDSQARKAKGYATYSLLGWAEAPHYDAATKVLYWAESAKFDQAEQPVLNYKVRILGARGVLEINYIDETRNLEQVRAAAASIMPHVAYAKGNAYADFQPGHDKVAEYGIGGLIAGGVAYGALKLGLFGLIGKFLLAFIKPIVFGAVFLFGLIAKLFGRKPARAAAPAAGAAPAGDARDQR